MTENDANPYSVHYLTEEEEKSIKSNIPWEHLESRIRELVLQFNKVDGIATIQSCAGHVRLTEHDTFYVESANICLHANEKRFREILEKAPELGIRDISLRYFRDGSFWISLDWEPGEYGPAYSLARYLLGDESE